MLCLSESSAGWRLLARARLPSLNLNYYLYVVFIIFVAPRTGRLTESLFFHRGPRVGNALSLPVMYKVCWAFPTPADSRVSVAAVRDLFSPGSNLVSARLRIC